MNEIERIVDQLRRAFEGDAWSGPSVLELLAGVAAEQAAAKRRRPACSLSRGSDRDLKKAQAEGSRG